jgi:FixJ family two-component response regulator
MSDQAFDRGVKALERIGLVLAALYADRLEAMTQGRKAERLSRLGLSNAQIADALGTSENSINVSRVTHRKKRRIARLRSNAKKGAAAMQAKPKK